MDPTSAMTTTPAESASRKLRLAMIGMILGNGHPYSWSAIINGYNPSAMSNCPYPAIPRYLGAQPTENIGIDGARVTHLWTDAPGDGDLVAQACLIPNIVSDPQDVIGHVDAVLIATDDGTDHVRRVSPFIEQDIPVFVDKPMATTLAELRTFVKWDHEGARILSSSGMRYAPELTKIIANLSRLGNLRWIASITCKTWERYGIHSLEPAFRVLGPGFLSIRLECQPGLEVAHLIHRCGTHVTLPVIHDGTGSFGTFQICGTEGQEGTRFTDTYQAFRSQLLGFIEFVRTGVRPFPFADTVEMMAILIAGIRSREEGSRRVELNEIISQIHS
jgi:predicted dehydrogenase